MMDNRSKHTIRWINDSYLTFDTEDGGFDLTSFLALLLGLGTMIGGTILGILALSGFAMLLGY